MSLRTDCDYIVKESISHVLPDATVKRALSEIKLKGGRLVLVSVGKAAWSMARAAFDVLGDRIDDGIVITKYGYSQGKIGKLTVCEAAHPIPDENSFAATEKALEITRDLSEHDTVIFLLSGGGSALFELPLIDPAELMSITNELLACGADIVEINTIRKRLSGVKGGRFAKHCEPAQIFSVVLSDIIGDPLDMIASGPACEDKSTCLDALGIIEKYGLHIPNEAMRHINTETPKCITNVTNRITGSVRELCTAAADACRKLGYEPKIITDTLNCEAKDAGLWLASTASENAGSKKPLAFIAGGETVVHLTGSGKGGRNQELALSAARGIAGLENTAVFSFGSDGTDGPTDAAGGFVTGDTVRILSEKGIDIDAVLRENNSYTALSVCGGLIITGATGTNVNDAAVVLMGGKV